MSKFWDRINNKFKFPSNINTKKAKLAYLMFRFLYARSVGQGQIIGRVTEMFPELIAVIVFLELYTPLTFVWWHVLVMAVLSFTITYFIGVWWMKQDFDRIDMQVSAERNPIMTDIHKSTVKERDNL